MPSGGLFLTAGADVQKDRIEVSVWAWGRGLTSWFVDHIVIDGGPEHAGVQHASETRRISVGGFHGVRIGTKATGDPVGLELGVTVEGADNAAWFAVEDEARHGDRIAADVKKPAAADLGHVAHILRVGQIFNRQQSAAVKPWHVWGNRRVAAGGEWGKESFEVAHALNFSEIISYQTMSANFDL